METVTRRIFESKDGSYCFLDECRGYVSICKTLVNLAKHHGFDSDNEFDDSDTEFLPDWADEALEYINAHLCDDGVSLDWHEGSVIVFLDNEESMN